MPDNPRDRCNCRSVEECTHKFADVSQEEINEIVREDMRKLGFVPKSVPMVIYCPACQAVHVDEGEWATRPHRTHQCQKCKLEWRPYPYATIGVELGDGEPSPRHCPHCEAGIPRGVNQKTGHFNEGQFAGWCRYMVSDADYKRMYSGGESGAAQEVSPRIISRETFPELGGETTVEVFEAVSPPSPEQERDQLLFALGCQLGGVKSALEVIDAKNEFIEQAEGDTRELKAALRWISVEEREPPKDGSEVLLRVKYRAGIPHGKLVGHWMRGGHCIEDHPPIESGWYFWNGTMFDRAAEPTHWMALPGDEGL